VQITDLVWTRKFIGCGWTCSMHGELDCRLDKYRPREKCTT
jgi:hypothetical protein